MGEVAIVTSRGTVAIPARICSKYGIREGSKLEFIETEDGIHLLPLKSLRELRGAFKGHEKAMIQAIRDLEREHQNGARSCRTLRGRRPTR